MKKGLVFLRVWFLLLKEIFFEVNGKWEGGKWEMGDQPFLKKMGPYKRLGYDSTGILYGISVRVFFYLTQKSEHSAQGSKTREKSLFLFPKKFKN